MTYCAMRSLNIARGHCFLSPFFRTHPELVLVPFLGALSSARHPRAVPLRPRTLPMVELVEKLLARLEVEDDAVLFRMILVILHRPGECLSRPFTEC